MKVNWMLVGALFGALAVAMGAFGAHGLKAQNPGPEALDWWKTAAQYHLLHAPVLMIFGLFLDLHPKGAHASQAPGFCLLIGAAIFSGTLYAMALGAPSILGAVTPIGGVLLVAGWSLFAWQARSVAVESTL
ncbi:MAG: uncharacterized membrane protein YgdD (TMEM256/DUF423 family) [Glaciecola sp.]|jgi:uncharacterized membrane protein YgdD (TMEM256/DUF423 family)